MILFQQPYLTIEYDAQSKCLSQHWKGYAKSEQFRAGITKSIELCQKHKPSKLISNTKELAIVTQEDTQWAATYATPMMVQHGLKHMAFIVPSNVFTQASVKSFKSEAEDKLQIAYFDELTKAQDWLAGI
ncbi:hypothetical protein GXP67_05655 [Rhodocytophaga rosea]|uniref:STAS/SEC14 domain-containing protein n=1 Tax=Rhodocytophaga rosea TaxID=2704465 RepID=A0A6C0GEU0_9BACT|nr:hypothetical protein [Rhodocytophaga rosea]QHT66190.1 hypothetical protein GXP67_05655 [Rhodocytophaga rosea]